MKVLINEESVKAIKDIVDSTEDQPSNVRLYVAGFG